MDTNTEQHEAKTRIVEVIHRIEVPAGTDPDDLEGWVLDPNVPLTMSIPGERRFLGARISDPAAGTGEGAGHYRVAMTVDIHAEGRDEAESALVDLMDEILEQDDTGLVGAFIGEARRLARDPDCAICEHESGDEDESE